MEYVYITLPAVCVLLLFFIAIKTSIIQEPDGIMRVDEDSWHFKFLKKWNAECIRYQYRQPTLCHYFWCFVGYVFLTIVIAAIVVTVSMFLTSPITQFFFEIDPKMVQAGGLVDIIFLMIFFVCKRVEYKDRLREEGKLPPRSAPSTNMFVVMWRAHKEKYCPVLEIGKPQKENAKGEY